MADRERTDGNREAESQDPATIGNRPATGARLVEGAASLPSTFGGGQEATDFLGLSQEIHGAEPAAPAIGPYVPPSPTPHGTGPSDTSASWLLAESANPEPEEASEEDFGDLEQAPVAETGGSRRLLSVAVAVLVIGAVVTVAMRFKKSEEPATSPIVAQSNPPKHTEAPGTSEDPAQLSGSSEGHPSGREMILPNGQTVPVEHAEPPTPVPTNAHPETVTTPPDVAIAADPVAVPVGKEPVQPAAARIATDRLVAWMTGHGWSKPNGRAESDLASLPAGAPSTPAGWPTPATFAFSSSTRNAMPPAGSASTEIDPRAQNVPLVYVDAGTSGTGNALTMGAPRDLNGTKTPAAQGAPNLRFASREDLANIWTSTAIPTDAIEGDVRIMTPAVGVVRVVLKTGEIFEGRLYAVGQGQVWIESDIGRLALGSQRVREIDPVVLEKQARVVEDLPRMRVRTPGGLFFGKVLARDDVHVTLLLDNGGRITLESSDIDPAPLGDTRVIGPLKP